MAHLLCYKIAPWFYLEFRTQISWMTIAHRQIKILVRLSHTAAPLKFGTTVVC